MGALSCFMNVIRWSCFGKDPVHKTFMRDVSLLLPLLVALSFLAFASIAAYRAFAEVDHLLVIRYDARSGIEALGEAQDVMRFLIVGWAGFVLNVFLAIVLYSRVRFFSHVLAWFTAFFALLIFAAAIIMININS